MSTPYYCDLFYEDVGFTNDYSNVLQFNTKQDRETYFDNIAHYHIENTDFNNMNVYGNTIKVAFYDLQSVDLDEINYLRIGTRLYGTANTLDTLEYGFVVDYEVLSSAENCTVVQFIFEKDIWMNYQFNFELKECNVERSHMDRWNRNDNKMKYTRPCGDLLDSYMRVTKDEKIYDEERYLISTGYVTRKIAWCFCTYATAGSDQSTAELRILFFPIEVGPNATAIIYDRYIDIEQASDTSRRFPDLSHILKGNLAHCFGIAPSAIYNVCIIFHTAIKFNCTYNPSQTSGLMCKNEIYGSHYVYEHGGVNGWVAYYIDTDALNYITNLPWKDDEIHIINGSMPEKPVNGADYAYKYEPMLYKSPIMKKYVTNNDGSQNFLIPDIKMMELNNIYIKTLVSPSEVYNIISVDELQNESISSNVLASTVGQIDSEQCDMISSYWQEYCVTQRDADRKMMWANILTGATSDAGSTGISAGIGYRSNAERAELAKINSNLSPETSLGQQNLYSKFAKQAVGMSIVGGIAQGGANAARTFIAQQTKEDAIKNKPASIVKTGNWYGKITSQLYETQYIELTCDEESYKQYANIFKKFGYAIYGVITPNIKSRKYFNYIKTAGAILTGNVNQSILANLAVLFDKGMTIWHMDYTTKATLYDYTKENIERSLM